MQYFSDPVNDNILNDLIVIKISIIVNNNRTRFKNKYFCATIAKKNSLSYKLSIVSTSVNLNSC